MTRVLVFLALSLTGGAFASNAFSQTYPDRPVRFVAPLPVSGPLDVMARLYAQKLSQRWGKPVIVDNRIGATGTIGTDSVVKAAPDGYTLLFTVDLPIVMAPALFKPPYDAKRDLLPIVGVADGMNLVMVHPSIGVKTLAEFVAAAKTKPSQLTFSSAGNGSPGHLCGEMLKSAAGIDITHVPYKGAAFATMAVLSGEVSMFCGPIPQALPHLTTGKLRALATTGPRPSPLTPDLKPLSDTYPGVVSSNWYALFAPVGTPRNLLTFVRDEVRKVWEEPEVRVRLSGLGLDPLWMEPGDVTAAIERDLAKWSKVVREAKVKLD